MKLPSAEVQQKQRHHLWKRIVVVALLLVGLVLVLILLIVLPWVAKPFPIYSYVSGDGKFDEIEVPAKGRTLGMVEGYFAEYRKQVGQPDLILYRTTERVWWHYWEWSDYASNPRWSYPYREPGPTESPGR